MFLGLGLTVDDTTAYNTAGGVGGGIAFRGKRNSSGTQTVYGAIVGTKNLYLLILTHGGKNESSTKFSSASYSW